MWLEKWEERLTQKIQGLEATAKVVKTFCDTEKEEFVDRSEIIDLYESTVTELIQYFSMYELVGKEPPVKALEESITGEYFVWLSNKLNEWGSKKMKDFKEKMDINSPDTAKNPNMDDFNGLVEDLINVVKKDYEEEKHQG
jgi:hypothetical protein